MCAQASYDAFLHYTPSNLSLCNSRIQVHPSCYCFDGLATADTVKNVFCTVKGRVYCVVTDRIRNRSRAAACDVTDFEFLVNIDLYG